MDFVISKFHHKGIFCKTNHLFSIQKHFVTMVLFSGLIRCKNGRFFNQKTVFPIVLLVDKHRVFPMSSWGKKKRDESTIWAQVFYKTLLVSATRLYHGRRPLSTRPRWRSPLGRHRCAAHLFGVHPSRREPLILFQYKHLNMKGHPRWAELAKHKYLVAELLQCSGGKI